MYSKLTLWNEWHRAPRSIDRQRLLFSVNGTRLQQHKRADGGDGGRRGVATPPTIAQRMHTLRPLEDIRNKELKHAAHTDIYKHKHTVARHFSEDVHASVSPRCSYYRTPTARSRAQSENHACARSRPLPSKGEGGASH